MKFILLVISLSFSSLVWSMDWLAINTLENVRVDAVGNIYGNTKNAYVKDGCNTTNFYIAASQLGYNAMFSALLTGLTTQKNIQLSFAECNAAGTIRIDGVRINK